MSTPLFAQRITIKHPGYGGNNTILALPACDGVGASGKAHYATIYSACVIVANNNKNGWLSLSRTGEPPTCADSEGLIPAGVYFFHVKSGSNSVPYPIVPSFRAWVFPHDDLPSLWQVSAQNAVSIEAPTAIETCRLTRKRLACENAHIIPSAEKCWFADNEMDRYGQLSGRTGQDVADSPANSIKLRRDVHLLWDSLFFSIVPKEARDDGGEKTTWRAHSMVSDEELHTDYHNRPTEPLAGRPVEYLYARFAWDVFPKVIGFLQSTQPRRLAVRRAGGEMEVRIFSIQECREFTRNQGRGRSASPTKRSRGPDGKVYEHADIAEVRCITGNKRQRRITSPGQSDSNDSAVSDVDSSSDLENASLLDATSMENHLSVKGWTDLQNLTNAHCIEDDCENARGRKRYRAMR